MSNWTNFQDDILNNLKFDNVNETLAKESADSFISQIKDQAKAETGWVKIRDLIVLPYIIYGGL